MPIPHPSTDILTLQALIRETNLLQHLRLMSQPLDGDIVNGLLEKLLTSSRVVWEHPSRHRDRCKVLSQSGKVEWNFVIWSVRFVLGYDRPVFSNNGVPFLRVHDKSTRI